MEEKIGYLDTVSLDWGNVGDPRWPKVVTARIFRRDKIGQRLLIDERRYQLIEDTAERVDKKEKFWKR